MKGFVVLLCGIANGLGSFEPFEIADRLNSERSKLVANKIVNDLGGDHFIGPFTKCDANSDVRVTLNEVAECLSQVVRLYGYPEDVTMREEKKINEIIENLQGSKWDTGMDLKDFEIFWSSYFVSFIDLVMSWFDENGDLVLSGNELTALNSFMTDSFGNMTLDSEETEVFGMIWAKYASDPTVLTLEQWINISLVSDAFLLTRY